jgi:hypothetical protein
MGDADQEKPEPMGKPQTAVRHPSARSLLSLSSLLHNPRCLEGSQHRDRATGGVQK